MKKIKEVIVVEGKDDTKRLALAVDADTLETNGSAISEATLAQIKTLQASRGVIVFTDPDFSGERIRKTISAAVPGVKHAFLPRKAGVPTKAGGAWALNTRAQRRSKLHLPIYIRSKSTSPNS